MTENPATIPPMDPDLGSCFVMEVKIDGPTVEIVCSCGWKSQEHEDETAARAEWEEHRQ